jgi:hypothetical protein
MDLVEQCLAAEFKFESVLQARFPVLKGTGAEATALQVNIHLNYLGYSLIHTLSTSALIFATAAIDANM